MSQSSEDSPPAASQAGPRRNPCSPPHHTLYDSTHRQHHSRSENWNPSGPGHPGDFSGQYLPYNGSSESYQPTPFSAVHNNHGRLPALTTLVSVDGLSTKYDLDSAQRKDAHAFCKLGGDDRAVVLYLRLLHTENQNKDIQEQMKEMGSRLDAISQFCNQAWQPLAQQVKLLKSLLGHYIIRPITSYTNLVSLAKTYVHDHAKRLHLELYKLDPTIKAAIHDLLAAENNGVRSALRKLAFSKKIISSHHSATIPTTPPQDIMASLGLMRETARPLVGKETSRGGDTGFWTNLEKELDVLFEKNGNKRDGSKWKQ
ncbi:hypothetical protein B0H17DRAFT_1126150 [Mycena rosella]|uniref:Uncharacterized protein n=1 Tax=Mycena rosella TaxID=1033263 RepID=A0AAD7GU66_MYCRO|nr:hypothetical protein B0H17DRAFT_1126150 [Mycena rosella]